MSTTEAGISGELSQKVSLTRRLQLEAARKGLRYYLQNVVINSSPTPKSFGQAAETWQRELLAPMVPAFEYLAGLNPGYYDTVSNTGGPLSFMSILARGHDKSSLEGRLCSWALIASKRPIHGYILAADRDQGRLILQAMEDEANLNPWVRGLLTINKNTVTGPAGFVEVLPCDAASAYGLRGNLYIADEFTHWKRQKEWTAMFTGREKIPGSLMVVLSNAGLIDSWQWNIREEVRTDPDWVVFERPGQLASWMSAERIEKAKRLLPPSEADRLYDNRWIDPATEFDYVRRYEVEGCASIGRALGIFVRLRRSPGVSNYVAAIDYGSRKDRCVLVVGHMSIDHTFIVDRMDVWQGTPAAPVQVERVEDWIRDIERTFAPQLWVVDPYQMEGTIQKMDAGRLGGSMTVHRFTGRGGQDNFKLAQHLRAIIVNKRLAWYPGAGDLDVVQRDGSHKRETFMDELVGLRVKKMPYGFRFDHENQKHDDRAVAVGMASLAALEFPWVGAMSEKAEPLKVPDKAEVYGYDRHRS